LRDDPTDPRYLITEPGAREAYAKLADTLRPVADIRVAAIELSNLVQLKLSLDDGLPENISRIYKFHPITGRPEARRWMPPVRIEEFGGNLVMEKNE
jgi:hypothetical protein